MPNGNNNQSTNNNDQTKTDDQAPIVSFPAVEETLPPMPQASEQVIANSVQVEQKTEDIVNPSPADTGSAAPSDDIVMPQVIGTAPPKKKFAGGKVIATILGLFLLVGGVGAGVFLTGQNQNIREQAAGGSCSTDADCGDKEKCHCDNGQPCEGGECVNETWVTNVCTNDGRFFCRNSGGSGRWTCCERGYTCCGNDAQGKPINGCCSGGQQTQVHRPRCVDAIKIFDNDWKELDREQLSALKPGEIIKFAIRSQATIGDDTFIFEAAKFIVNGTETPETTLKHKKGWDYFYYEYTIPPGVKKFEIYAMLKITLFNGKVMWVGYKE